MRMYAHQTLTLTIHAGLLGALESQAVEEAPMQGGQAAAAQPAYEPPAESALLADGLIEPVRASSQAAFLVYHQAEYIV